MKKNILKVTLVAAIAMACGISFLNSQKSETLSDIALANVEALAAAVTHKMECGQPGLKMCEAICSRCNVTLRSYGNGGTVTLTCGYE